VSDPVPAPLRSALTAGARCLVLSPHLDDAVLSCGALLRELAPRCEITVLTLFTEATDGPHGRAARSFLRQCAHPDAATLFRARRDEDRAVVESLGARPEHLGLTDALFRRRELPTALAPVARLVPELAHRYPTFRFDIARGRVSRVAVPDEEELAAVDGIVLPGGESTTIAKLADRGFEGAVAAAPALARGVSVLDGQVTSQPVAEALGHPFVPLAELVGNAP